MPDGFARNFVQGGWLRRHLISALSVKGRNMKPQDLMTLALRVLAVFIASQALVSLADAAVFAAVNPPSQDWIPFSILAVIILLGPAIAALAIWWFAPHLARWAARGIGDVPVVMPNVQSVVGATFVVAGTLIFVLALPVLIVNTIRAFEQPGMFVLSSLVASVVRCLLGVFLVFGSRATSRFLLWLRYAGSGARDS